MTIPGESWSFAGRFARLALRGAVRAAAFVQADDARGALLGTVPSLDAWASTTGRAHVVRLNAVPSLRLPSTVTRDVPPTFASQDTLVFPSPYATALPETRLLGPEGHVVVDRRVVLDVSPVYGRDERDHPALLRFRRAAPSRLNASALVLTGLSPKNHYHWLFDILPRYAVARAAGLRWDRVVTYARTPVHATCLARLGVSLDHVVPPSWTGQLDIAEGIVPSVPSLRESPSPFAVEFLRDLFARDMAVAPSSPRRLYLRRGRGVKRQIRNEDAVRGLLEQHGFATVELEHLPLDEQVALFANAEVIVGPHGAALANLAFCRPGTRVVELFAQRFTPRCYQYLAAIAGLEYACLIEGGDGTPRASGHHSGDDMSVDVDALARLLRAG